LQAINTTDQRTGLVDNPVRVRQDLPFLQVLREHDLKLTQEKRLARGDLLFPDERRTPQPAAVGATGIAVNSAALWFFVSVLQVQLLLGAALATPVSTLWNYVLSDRLVFKGPKSKSGLQRLLGFALVNNVVLLARLPFLSLLVHGLGVGYLLSNIITLVAAFGVRYLVSDRYLFQSGESMTMTQGRTRTARPRSRRSAASGPAPRRSPRYTRSGR
jgi:putative flippase GtrA